MRPAIIVAAVIAVVVVSSLLFLGWQHAGDTDDPGTDVSGLPEGFTVDEGSGTVTAPECVEWHVFDVYHTYYDTNQFGSFTTLYEGYDEYGQSITLDVGKYLITAGDQEFTVVNGGDVSRTVDWTYDMDGTVYQLSVTYTFSLEDFMASADASEARNQELSSYKYYPFTRLPDIVVCDPITDSLESLLRQEFVGIGGSVSDEQGYADFIASFVQGCAKYPNTVDGKGYDYGIRGVGEYWAVPAETLYLLYGDCEDNAALLCALLKEAGYTVAMGGKNGHVFAGVALESFEPVDQEWLDHLGVGYMVETSSTPVVGSCSEELASTVFYAVETIKGQSPVGYIASTSFGSNTWWGTTGFYPVED